MRPAFVATVSLVALLALALGVSARAGGTPTNSPPVPAAPSVEQGPPVARPSVGVLSGLCEASALLPDADGYLIGDNESEDVLYRFGPDFAPRGTVRLGARVEDIEALAAAPDGRVLVVGSQSLNRNGKPRPDRERVLLLGSTPVRPDLSACAPCMAARNLPPKSGGLSIEGAAWWAGAWWLGVRSPAAFLLRLEGDPSTSLVVAQVLPLDLGGLGVRDLYVNDDRLHVLAGPLDDRPGEHAVYRIDAPGAPPFRMSDGLPPGSEGLIVEDGALVVVTDGKGEPDGPCEQPARWIVLPNP